jgi:hypothetical protein
LAQPQPRFKPIENVWFILKDKVMKRNPKKLEDLRKYLFEEWDRLDQKIIQKMGLSKKSL